MNFVQLEKIKFNYLRKFFLPKKAVFVCLPISLNIAGKIYHLETNMISNEYLYLRIYEEDFEFLPDSCSNLILFISLDLFSNGKFELEGRLVSIERLIGNRLGLWILYKTETKKDREILSEFFQTHYTPRYSVRFDVDVKTEIKFMRSEAINLSEKGIFLEAPINLLEERQICELILYPENLSIRVKAQVSWINKGKMYDKPNGYGLKFLLDKKSESEIIRYLKLLKNRSAILR